MKKVTRRLQKPTQESLLMYYTTYGKQMKTISAIHRITAGGVAATLQCSVHSWLYKNLLKHTGSEKSTRILLRIMSYNNNNYYYLLQLGFHPVAVVLTLVHTIQMEI
jgi:hypothetical protein